MRLGQSLTFVVWRTRPSGKAVVFLRLLSGAAGQGGRTLLFTQSLFVLDVLEEMLRDKRRRSSGSGDGGGSGSGDGGGSGGGGGSNISIIGAAAAAGVEAVGNAVAAPAVGVGIAVGENVGMTEPPSGVPPPPLESMGGSVAPGGGMGGRVANGGRVASCNVRPLLFFCLLLLLLLPL